MSPHTYQTFEQVYCFENLMQAHARARLGKRDRSEVIQFELNLGANLIQLSDSLKDGSYQPLPYARFTIDDPKRRVIHSLHYRDRVVQHSLCDNVVAPILEPRLIYDNAACRKGKGTHFAIGRLKGFMREHYRHYGNNGWFLKCDVRHFFDEIPHDKLIRALHRCPFDADTFRLMELIVHSFQSSSGCGLPLGNQSSQWFALYYLDSLDRLVKERLREKAYTRYMDDMVLILESREEAVRCLNAMADHLSGLGLAFNRKTQVFPVRQGVDYLGWHLKLTETGHVAIKMRAASRKRMVRRMKCLQELLRAGVISREQHDAALQSYSAYHASFL